MTLGGRSAAAFTLLAVGAGPAWPDSQESPSAGPSGGIFAPGFERIALRDGPFLRARILDRAGGDVLVEMESGERLLTRAEEVTLELARDEPFPGAPRGVPPNRLTLPDGHIVSGVLLARTPEGFLIDAADGRVFVATIRGRAGPAPIYEFGPAPTFPPVADRPAEGSVRLRSGRVLQGLILGRGRQGVLIETEGLGRVMVLDAALEGARAAGAQSLPRPWRDDPSDSRYLYVPSGIRLLGGQWLVSQSLAVTTVAFGITDHLSVSAGAAWPVAYAASASVGTFVALDAGIDLGDVVHVSAGAVGYAEAGAFLGFLRASVTVGTGDLSLSLYGGPAMPSAHRLGLDGDRMAAISGLWRPARRWALLTETWLTGAAGDVSAGSALAVRLWAWIFTLDLGAMVVPAEAYPVPWIGLAYAHPAPREVRP